MKHDNVGTEGGAIWSAIGGRLFSGVPGVLSASAPNYRLDDADAVSDVTEMSHTLSLLPPPRYFLFILASYGHHYRGNPRGQCRLWGFNILDSWDGNVNRKVENKFFYRWSGQHVVIGVVWLSALLNVIFRDHINNSKAIFFNVYLLHYIWLSVLLDVILGNI